MCINCHERPGYTILQDCCTRCARDLILHDLNFLMDQATIKWANFADLIYRHEILEGERIAPSLDHARPHGVGRDVRTGQQNLRSDARSSSPSLKHSGRGHIPTDDDL